MRYLLSYLSLAVIACSSSTPTPVDKTDVEQICDRFAACGTMVKSECMSSFVGWIPPASCLPSLLEAPCADVNLSPMPQALHDACMPPCTRSLCSDDYSVELVCDADRGAAAYACPILCQLEGKSTGYCTLAGRVASCTCF